MLKVGNFADILQAGAFFITHDIMELGDKEIHMPNVESPVHFLRDGEEGVQNGVVVADVGYFGLEGSEVESPVDQLGEVEVAETLQGVLFGRVGGLFFERGFFAFPCGFFALP